MDVMTADVMTANLVESLVDGICYHLDTDGLEAVIAHNLDEPFIAHNDAGQMDAESAEHTYGTAEHVQTLRMMYSLFNIPPAQEIDRHLVRAIDARVQAAPRGPLFFNLMLTLYSYWSARWAAENADEDAGVPGVPAVPYAEAFQAMQGTDIRVLLRELCPSPENTHFGHTSHTNTFTNGVY